MSQLKSGKWLKCNICQSKIYRTKGAIFKSKHKRFYCSDECRHKGTETGSWFNCKFCNKKIYRNMANQRKAKRGTFVCSKKCFSPRVTFKVRARQAAHKALKKGKIKKPVKCQRCKTKTFLQAHHHNYDRPLQVEWICRHCHDVEHYQVRVDLVESRRKHFLPCKCGRKARVRYMCLGCYARWRFLQVKERCNVPLCERTQHSIGLCGKHRQHPQWFKYASPRKKPGPKPKSLT